MAVFTKKISSKNLLPPWSPEILIRSEIKKDGTVDIFQMEEKMVIKRTVSLKSYCDTMAEAVNVPPPPEPVKWIQSPILPPGTIAFQHTEKGDLINLVLAWGPDLLPFMYEGTLYEAVPFPRLLFKLKISRKESASQPNLSQVYYQINKIQIVAVKETGLITPNTPLFHYPYSHVHSSSLELCFGQNKLPIADNLLDFYIIPRVVLTYPNSDHYYVIRETNLSGLNLRPLLAEVEKLDNFPDEWLAPLPLTMEEWMK